MIPRLSTSGCSFTRPTRRTTPLLKPPSRYSLMSASSSRPLHSAKPPLPSGAGGAPPPLRVSRTSNRNDCTSSGSATAGLHTDGPVGVLRYPQHQVLQRAGRGDSDLGDQLAEFLRHGRVQLVIALDEERVRLGVPR